MKLLVNVLDEGDNAISIRTYLIIDGEVPPNLLEDTQDQIDTVIKSTQRL